MDLSWIDFFVAVMLGWALGSMVTRFWLHITFREILKDLKISEQDLRTLLAAKDTAEPTELPTLEVKIEQHEGTLYAFRKDTDQFLGQGTDREQLIDSLKHNLTNVRVIIAQEDGAELLQKNNT